MLMEMFLLTRVGFSGDGNRREYFRLGKCLQSKGNRVTRPISKCPILEDNPDFLGAVIIGAIVRGFPKEKTTNIIKITPEIGFSKGKGGQSLGVITHNFQHVRDKYSTTAILICVSFDGFNHSL